MLQHIIFDVAVHIFFDVAVHIFFDVAVHFFMLHYMFFMLHYIILRCCSFYITMLHYVVSPYICDVALEVFSCS